MSSHRPMDGRATSSAEGRGVAQPLAIPENGTRTNGGASQEESFTGRAASSAVSWSLLAVVARQGLQMLCALVLARILGPTSYGVISAATIYVTLTTLILDQGMASALVQRRQLDPKAPGAVASFNILIALILAVATWILAPEVADFFSTPALGGVLRVLGIGLVLKALAITPRSMLSRGLKFRRIAISDVAGAGCGTITGLTAAIFGASYHAVVYQTVVTDVVIAALLWRASRGPSPNLAVGALREVLPFGFRVFATNSIAYFARNTDNILVARILGVTALSFYSMAYRALVIPIQMVGQTVNRVMFPVFAKIAHRRDLLAENLVKSTEMVAMAAVPTMTLLACAAPELVRVVLGPQWGPTARLLSVLALAGARETIYYITPALMKATGHASLNLRFELVSTAVQVAGIVIGLQFGVFGVAVGYAVSGILITPMLLLIQRRLTGVSITGQLQALVPSIHPSMWGAAGYLLVAVMPFPSWATLLAGGSVFVGLFFFVLLTMHRAAALRAWRRIVLMLPARFAVDTKTTRSGPRHAL